MALIDEIKSEIMQGKEMTPKPVSPESEAAKEPKKRQRREKTPEEIEAYRQKKMAEEEARYLGETPKKRRKRKAKEEKAPEKAPVKRRRRRRKDKAQDIQKAQKSPRKLKVQSPKVLQPLEPLYLLRIPGLPKGDCIRKSAVAA